MSRIPLAPVLALTLVALALSAAFSLGITTGDDQSVLTQQFVDCATRASTVAAECWSGPAFPTAGASGYQVVIPLDLSDLPPRCSFPPEGPRTPPPGAAAFAPSVAAPDAVCPLGVVLTPPGPPVSRPHAEP